MLGNMQDEDHLKMSVCMCVCGHNAVGTYCPEHFRVIALDISNLPMALGLLYSSKAAPLPGEKVRDRLQCFRQPTSLIAYRKRQRSSV